MLREVARWTLLALAAVAGLTAMSDEPQQCSPFWDEWPCLLGLSRDR